MDAYDLLIVGGGPVGLFAAAMAGLHGLGTAIVESLPQLGGQLTALYPEKRIFDVAGFTSVTGADLAGALIAQALHYRPALRLGVTAESLQSLEDGTHLLVTGDGQLAARTVLVTAGLGAFAPRELSAEGIERYVGADVHYVPPALREFRGKDVVVVGGGDTALDWAWEIAQYARRVYLVHRRREFRAQSGSLDRIRQLANVQLKTPCELRAVQGGDALTHAVLEHLEGGGVEAVEAQAIVSGLGFHAQLGPLKTWGLTFQGSHAIAVDPATMATNLPGVYAAGDIAAYPGKVKLIATGFGEVGIAMGPIRAHVHPEWKGALPHSTNLKPLADRPTV